jgi:hypothetical protein
VADVAGADATRARLRRRRGRFIALAAVLGAGAVGFALRPPAPPPAEVAAPGAAAVPAPAKSAAKQRPTVAPAAPRVPAAASAALPGPGEAEVCGLGIVRVDGHDPSGLKQVPEASRREAYVRLQAVMQASPDARVRAAGLLLESRWLAGRAAETLAAATPACAASDAACRREARRTARTASALAAAPATDALAQRAAGSSDAEVYAFAVEACARDEALVHAAPWCQQVSVEQWARLEPDNAVPWLEVAAAARRRGDAAAENDAMYRASVAPQSDAHRAAPARMAAEMMPPDAPEAGRSAVIVELAAAPSAIGGRGLDAVNRHCAADALRDANRRQTCDALADALAARGTTLREAAVGRRLGERLGWPGERVQGLRDEQRALAAAASRYLTEFGRLSCAGVQRRTRWLAMVAAQGEIGAARELLDRFGAPPPAASATAR